MVVLPPVHKDAEPEIVADTDGAKTIPRNGWAATVVASVVGDVTVVPLSTMLTNESPVDKVA